MRGGERAGFKVYMILIGKACVCVCVCVGFFDLFLILFSDWQFWKEKCYPFSPFIFVTLHVACVVAFSPLLSSIYPIYAFIPAHRNKQKEAPNLPSSVVYLSYIYISTLPSKATSHETCRQKSQAKRNI